MPEPADAARRSPLIEHHLAAGATLVHRDGWDVPAHYGDADAECLALHNRAGVMDLTPMGRIRVRGDGGLALLERLCTADVARQEDATVLRSLLLNERGGVIDIVRVLRLDGWWVLNCSAGRRQAVIDHLKAHADAFGAKVDDQTFKTATLAVVGPVGAEILDRFLPNMPSRLEAGEVRTGSMMIANYIAARTGETDLWSLEVTLPNMLAGQAWKFATAKAGDSAIRPVGTDAAEVLRIEARLPRWGREFDEDTDPATAGLGRWVRPGNDFLGAEALTGGGGTRRVAWAIEPGGQVDRSPAVTPGDTLRSLSGEPIGAVTSAAFSPAARTWLGQARGAANVLGEGSAVSIEAQTGRQHVATVIEVF